MRRTLLLAAASAMVAAGSALPVRADLLWDVEAARANARAGGPLSSYDKELLDHWGCESGTRDAYCKKIRHGATTFRRPHHHHKRRAVR